MHTFISISGFNDYDCNDGTQILKTTDACFSNIDTVETDL